MRFSIILLLLCLSSLSFAATDSALAGNIRYVWAKSGLTLRADNQPGATKITIIPYGAEVSVEENWGTPYRVKALNGWKRGQVSSLPYRLEGQYLKVWYGDQVGYAFSAYLLPYQAPLQLAAGEQGNPAASTEPLKTWQKRLFGSPDTLHCNFGRANDNGQYECFTRYDNGIMVRSLEQEGGGSTEMIIPDLTLAQGFVLFDTFYGYSKTLLPTDDGYGEQMALIKATDDTLEFLYEDGYLSNDEIRQVGSFLFFQSSGGC